MPCTTTVFACDLRIGDHFHRSAKLPGETRKRVFNVEVTSVPTPRLDHHGHPVVEFRCTTNDPVTGASYAGSLTIARHDHIELS